jgi:RING-box protein 1
MLKEYKIQREKQNQKCLECNIDLDSNCHECKSNKSNNGEACDFAQGICDCVFHFHCISTHLKTKQNCPIHKTEWWYKRYWNHSD